MAAGSDRQAPETGLWYVPLVKFRIPCGGGKKFRTDLWNHLHFTLAVELEIIAGKLFAAIVSVVGIFCFYLMMMVKLLHKNEHRFHLERSKKKKVKFLAEEHAS